VAGRGWTRHGKAGQGYILGQAESRITNMNENWTFENVSSFRNDILKAKEQLRCAALLAKEAHKTIYRNYWCNKIGWGNCELISETEKIKASIVVLESATSILWEKNKCLEERLKEFNKP
jgi:hypothetical protein